MKSQARPSLLPTTILFVLAACADTSDDTSLRESGYQTRDSAGIRIVESSAPQWDGDGWSISASPTVAIGRVEGDERYLFGMIAGALVLRDGRIAVLDDVSALIRVYSPEGEHLEDWGGHGEGPGEFSSAESIFPYRGDSILVTEFVASRFTILDDQGRYGRNMIPDKMW